MVQEAVEQLQELLAECSAFQGRLPKSISFKGLQQRLEQVHSAVQLCQEVLGIEGAVSLLGSGPRGTLFPPILLSYSYDFTDFVTPTFILLLYNFMFMTVTNHQ